MRILHTADWHLGRLFYGCSLIDDQAYLLETVIAACKEVDLIIIAGDIFDRAIPPPEALELFDATLSEIALKIKIPIIFIAGNHDSPRRLAYTSRLLERNNIYVFTETKTQLKPLILEDAHGPISFYGLPYLEPATFKTDHQGAMEKVLAGVKQTGRNILIAHAFVSGGTESESERPLVLGGAERVTTDTFHAFDYVALGHLHHPQNLAAGRVRYSGSLMAYAFSERSDKKSLSIIDIDEQGAITLETIPLTPKRHMRTIKGELNTVLKAAVEDPNASDFLSISLTDTGAVYDAMGKLRRFYPYVMHLQREILQESTELDTKKLKSLSDQALFSGFIEEVAGREIKEKEKAYFTKIALQCQKENREEQCELNI